MSAKWTKKDIKTLCGTLSTFWLINRPLGDSLAERQRARDEVLRYLAENRTEIVVAGLSEHIVRSAERERENRDTAAHFSAHPEVYGSANPEMIERFTKLADEEHKAADKLAALIFKVQTAELPPEVISFDPTQPR